MSQSLGVIDVVWNGVTLAVEPGAKFMLGGLQNKTVAYGRGAARSQEFVPSTLEITTLLARGQRASDLYTTAEGELQIHCDTGQTIVAYAAWMTERPDFSGGDGGKVPLKWAFGEYEEIS
jgi:hypothetical protein